MSDEPLFDDRTAAALDEIPSGELTLATLPVDIEAYDIRGISTREGVTHLNIGGDTVALADCLPDTSEGGR